jgi:hypothetical protein
MPASSIHNGWRYDPVNSRLDFYYRGTRVGHIDANGLSGAAAIAATTTLAASTTVTAGTGVIATTGGVTASAGDIIGTAGNLRLGAISAFATTEPTSAVVMKTGTAPAGAITTSSGIFASTTVCRKIIADGTVSDVQT